MPVNKEKRDNIENQVNFQSFFLFQILYDIDYCKKLKNNNYFIQILNLLGFNEFIKIFIIKICILNKNGYNSIR